MDTQKVCIKCKVLFQGKNLRCPVCAKEHREFSKKAYYMKKYGAMPTGDITKGMRPFVRDAILNLMSDGVTRTSTEIREAIKWPTHTNITKTLGDLKVRLITSGDRRRLRKTKMGPSCRHGASWTLSLTEEPNT
jgi:hypothetical protein